MAYFVGSTEPLLESGAADDADTWTSGTKLAERLDQVAGSVFADKAGTIYIEQSSDGTNWDISTSYTTTANDGEGFAENLLLPYWRIRFTNSAGTAQTAFRISAHAISGGDS